MKIDQKVVAVYTVIGLLGGLISNYLMDTSVILASVVPFALCLLSLLLFVQMVKNESKKSRILFNGFFTFFLVWMTVWILLYNL